MEGVFDAPGVVVVKIGSTTYMYPGHSWYRNLFTFESNFVDADTATDDKRPLNCSPHRRDYLR